MKVLFINPSCLEPRVTDDDALQVPIGLYYLAASLMDKGIQAGILNLAPAGPANQSKTANKSQYPDPVTLFKDAIKREQPDVLGFSVTNPSRVNAVECARIARQLLPECLIVFGGPAPTFMVKHLFNTCPALDVIIKGEGEISTDRLVTALASHKKAEGKIHDRKTLAPELTHKLEDIPGIIFRQGNDFHDSGTAQLVQDLDTLPHPSKYFTYQHLAMSRGCPGRCTFCGSPKFWGNTSVRRHSPDWFFTEIKALAQKGVSHFFISDDTFTMETGAVKALCLKIINAGLKITWNAISRVDYIDESILPLMRQAGCIQISFGIESGSDKIKKVLGKPIDNETCIAVFNLVRSYGILPRAYFIYGSPGETDDTIQDSVELMERLAPLSTVFYMLVTFPGTRLYKRAIDKGWTQEEVWKQDIEDLPWFELDKSMDFNQVKKWGDRLRKAFFTNIATFVDRIELKPEKALFPFHSDFLSRLAMTFFQGEYAQDSRIENPERIAANLFEKALDYHPDVRAYYGLAMILQKNRNFTKVISLLEKGLNHFPENKDLSVCMGVCLMNTGNFKQALTFFIPFDTDPALGHYITICKQRINS
ncbi:MAG: radical SAM protein [Desulfobacterales bacterium]|nr:radical SAM protein [Desulfobacterales bacterium]